MKGILLVWFNWMPSQCMIYMTVSFWFYMLHGLVWFEIYILWVVPSDIYCTECLGPMQLVTGDLIICPLPSLERLPLPAIPPPIKSHREHTHRDETDKVVVPHKQKVLQTKVSIRIPPFLICQETLIFFTCGARGEESDHRARNRKRMWPAANPPNTERVIF